MAKRFGRTLISSQSSASYSYDARNHGSDKAQFAGNCKRPVVIQFTGQQSRILNRLKQFGKDGSIDFAEGYGIIGYFQKEKIRHVDVEVRCRKCYNCLKARAYQWRQRAKIEIGQANRTWFGTLTLRPAEHFRLTAMARHYVEGRAVQWDTLTGDEQFTESLRPIVKEFQRYMKRLRKSNAGLRHLMVIERHKSGYPHLHMLIHEFGEPVRHRQLKEQWLLGFTNWKLVNENEGSKAAAYVTKYLTKSLVSRVRASGAYGKREITSLSHK